jgi:hypothetical protein
MRFVTDFADQAVVLPVVAAIGIVLLAQGWRRGAAAWVGATAGTFGIMLLLKLVFIACPMSDLRTPSGHVAGRRWWPAGSLHCSCDARGRLSSWPSWPHW